MPPISRRKFIYLGSLGAGTAASMSVLAACGGDDPAGSGGDTGGGTDVTRVVFGVVPPAVETNNVTRDATSPDEWQLKPMYENLIGADPATGAWIPMLAERWELDPGGKSIRFFLRKGVRFHGDFGEVTAQDVLFTFQDLTEPPGALINEAELMRGLVKELEIVNDYEVVFHTDEANYDFFEAIGYGTGGMAIKSKKDWDTRGGKQPTLADKPLAGSGPYQYKERAPGERVVFERVPYQHWRKQPDFPELELRYITEDSARLAALVAKEIHITNLPNELTAEAEGRGAKVITASFAGRRMSVNFCGAYLKDPANSDEWLYPDSPMTDKRVRQAISKAIDRDAINQAFFAGQAEPLWMWYWLPELPGWNPDWETRWQEVYGYDPDRSRALLQEAGFSPGQLKVDCLGTPNRGGPETADVIEAVSGMLTDVGIEAPIVTMDVAEHQERQRALEFQCAIEFDDTRSEPITGFRPQGYANYHNRGRATESREIDKAYEAVRVELDPTRQAELWKTLGNLVFDWINHAPLLRTRETMVVDPEVVSNYTFPGAMLSVSYSHWEHIAKA